jgi:MFS family permease
LIGGMAAGCAALAWVGVAQSIPAVLAAWCLAQLAFNAALASMVAIVPDRIPAHQRGTVVGILGVCVPVGQIAGTYLIRLLSAHMLLSFLIPGLIGLAGVTMLSFCLGRNAAPVPQPVRRRDAALRPPDHGDFSWTWLSRVFFTTGSCFLQAYQPFFLIDSLGMDAADVPALVFRSTLVSAVMVVVWSLVSGRLSDRIGVRKPFVMTGSVVQGMGLFVVAASHSYGMLLGGVVLIGMGQGIYNGVDLALVTEVLPDRAQHAAKDLGLLNIANTLPQVVAPLAAPALLKFSDGHYSLMFAAAGIIAFFGSIALIPVRSVR